MWSIGQTTKKKTKVTPSEKVAFRLKITVRQLVPATDLERYRKTYKRLKGRKQYGIPTFLTQEVNARALASALIKVANGELKYEADCYWTDEKKMQDYIQSVYNTYKRGIRLKIEKMPLRVYEERLYTKSLFS